MLWGRRIGLQVAAAAAAAAASRDAVFSSNTRNFSSAYAY